MAMNPNDAFPTRTTAPDADYPYGGAQNVTLPSDGTGTPWVASLINDIFGFQQALLAAAGIVPTGDPETAIDSQYLDAINQIILDNVPPALLLDASNWPDDYLRISEDYSMYSSSGAVSLYPSNTVTGSPGGAAQVKFTATIGSNVASFQLQSDLAGPWLTTSSKGGAGSGNFKISQTTGADYLDVEPSKLKTYYAAGNEMFRVDATELQYSYTDGFPLLQVSNTAFEYTQSGTAGRVKYESGVFTVRDASGVETFNSGVPPGNFQSNGSVAMTGNFNSGNNGIINLKTGGYGPGGTNLSLSINGDPDTGIVGFGGNVMAMVAGIDAFSTASVVVVQDNEVNVNAGSTYIRLLRVEGEIHFRTGSNERMLLTDTGLDMLTHNITNVADPVGATDVVNLQYADDNYQATPPPLAGFFALTNSYYRNEALPVATISVAAIPNATWRSYGPTGSGATTIWTALDSLPLGVKVLHFTSQISAQIIDATANINLSAGGQSGILGIRTLKDSIKNGVVSANTVSVNHWTTQTTAANIFYVRFDRVDPSEVIINTADITFTGWSS